MFQKRRLRFQIFFLSIVFFILPSFVWAASVSLGQQSNFFVDSAYDLSEREEISASLQRIGQRAYFYIDTEWWNSLDYQEKQIVKQVLQDLDFEFSQKIYPSLTSTLGSEWNPGIDKDSQITILIHPMRSEVGGYFNNGDEYSKLQNPSSNEREMIYLNADSITHSLVKSFLAHEFTHLITFNQKERIYGIEEEIWLNEARAEYAPTLIGYDDKYEGSNLERRAKIFLAYPSDSLTEWQGQKADYGGLNLFIQYLVDHYGIEILADSLKSRKVGIESLNEAFAENGFEEDFSQIFTDWTIAVLANDCSLGEKYCYENENLKNFGVYPSLNFLPLKGKSTLGVTQTTKNWAGNWFQFVSGEGTLRIEFIGNPENLFRIPYLSRDSEGGYSLGFFQLDEHQRGEIKIFDFGKEINSVIIIPSIQTKTTGFLNPEPSFSYFWSASMIKGEEKENEPSPYLEKPISEMSKKEVLAKIAEIEELLNLLRNQLNKLAIPEELIPEEISCQKFEENLYYGIRDDERVRCLQEFLKSQGTEIYPEGLVTGNFLSLTKAAVIRFQEKYAEEILHPLDLNEGTGFFGPATRTKINNL